MAKRRHFKGSEDRFWDKVDKRGPDDCWLYYGVISGGGYGQHASSKFKNGVMVAHRYSWILAHGKIPEGLVVRHKCDVRNCVNPAHLELGTQRDNIHDTISRGRRVIARGDDYNRKLRSTDVIEILTRFKNSPATYLELAHEFKVSETAIKQVVSRKSWRHLGIPRHYRRDHYRKLAESKK